MERLNNQKQTFYELDVCRELSTYVCCKIFLCVCVSVSLSVCLCVLHVLRCKCRPKFAIFARTFSPWFLGSQKGKYYFHLCNKVTWMRSWRCTLFHVDLVIIHITNQSYLPLCSLYLVLIKTSKDSEARERGRNLQAHLSPVVSIRITASLHHQFHPPPPLGGGGDNTHTHTPQNFAEWKPCPPLLEKILDFIHLKRLKMHLNCPWLEKHLHSIYLKRLKMHSC